MAVTRCFAGSSAPRSGATPDPRVRLLGAWPEPLIRRTVAHGRSALLLGECLATDEELREALSHGGSLCEAAGSAASLSGSYCAIVSQGGQTALATDLAGLHRLWYREAPEGIEFASTPLALVRGSTADLDADALAARLFCSDFHTGLPGGSLYERVTEVPPDRVLLLNGASVSLAPRNPVWHRASSREGANALREALETGVRARFSGANTVTADLSGGMDSSTLALLAARHRDDPLPALTYTDPFAVNDDDADYAALLASRASGLEQVIVKGNAACLPFTGMDDVPLTDHPSLDTVIFARDRVRLLPASGACPHLVGDGGDAVLGAPLTYLTALTRMSALPRLVHETRGWARMRHRPVHRIMRSVWRASRTTYAATLAALATRLEGLPSNGFRGNGPRVERNIVWAHLGSSTQWGTPRARTAVAERLRHAAESVEDSHGVDAHTLRMLRRHADRHAIQPGVGLLAHRPAQLAERHVARGIASQKIHPSLRIGRISLLLRTLGREHDVAVRVVDRQHALRAGDADLEAVDRARPDDRQRPRDARVIEAAIGEGDHAGRGVDALAQRPERLVDRARVELDRALRFHQPHDDVERVGAERVVVDRGLDLEDLHNSYGIGIRFHGPTFTAFRVELARGSEGMRLILSGGAAF